SDHGCMFLMCVTVIATQSRPVESFRTSRPGVDCAYQRASTGVPLLTDSGNVVLNSIPRCPCGSPPRYARTQGKGLKLVGQPQISKEAAWATATAVVCDGPSRR